MTLTSAPLHFFNMSSDFQVNFFLSYFCLHLSVLISLSPLGTFFLKICFFYFSKKNFCTKNVTSETHLKDHDFSQNETYYTIFSLSIHKQHIKFQRKSVILLLYQVLIDFTNNSGSYLLAIGSPAINGSAHTYSLSKFVFHISIHFILSSLRVKEFKQNLENVCWHRESTELSQSEIPRYKPLYKAFSFLFMVKKIFENLNQSLKSIIFKKDLVYLLDKSNFSYVTIHCFPCITRP